VLGNLKNVISQPSVEKSFRRPSLPIVISLGAELKKVHSSKHCAIRPEWCVNAMCNVIWRTCTFWLYVGHDRFQNGHQISLATLYIRILLLAI